MQTTSEIRLREVTDAAATILTETPRRHAAMSYLRQRGIDARELPLEWVIGYAPPGWTRLVDALGERFTEAELVDAGVARVSSRGTLIDTFRDRVMFGVHTADGVLAGFIGRDLSGHPDAPRYLNTRAHALFDKGSLLYGLSEGRGAADAVQPVVVEGPLDVLAIAARRRVEPAGNLLPVAACGTGFTARHTQLVAELVCASDVTPVVAMDGDPAGRAAALRIGEQLRHSGAEPRFAMLPTGVDPADYLGRPGSDLGAFSADRCLPLINLRLEEAIAQEGDRMQWVEGRLAALQRVAQSLADYSPSFAARRVSWLAQTLDLTPSTVTDELVRACAAARPAHPVASLSNAVGQARGIEI